MKEVIISKAISTDELAKWNIESWSNWECEVSKFDWSYSDDETAYILSGSVIVEAYGKKYEINKGDLVHFPKGMACNWDIKEDIKKVYTFNHSLSPFKK